MAVKKSDMCHGTKEITINEPTYHSQKSSHHNSVPRLELVAALKAIELRKSIEKALKRKCADLCLMLSAVVTDGLINNSAQVGTPSLPRTEALSLITQ